MRRVRGCCGLKYANAAPDEGSSERTLGYPVGTPHDGLSDERVRVGRSVNRPASGRITG